MGSTTPNLGLNKPNPNDLVNVVTAINNNMDILDDHVPSTFRPIPVALAVSDWTLSDGVYTATFLTAYVTSTSYDYVVFDSSYENAVGGISAEKKSGGGGIVFTTDELPTGTIIGTISTIDTNDGKVPVLLQGTVVPIANGGTGASNLEGAQQALGISELADQIVRKVNYNATANTITFGSDGRWTATEDCFVFLVVSYDAAKYNYDVSVNGKVIYGSLNTEIPQPLLVPLSKGDILKVWTWSSTVPTCGTKQWFPSV